MRQHQATSGNVSNPPRIGLSGNSYEITPRYASPRHVMYRLAPALGEHFTLVIAYGWSATPRSQADHAPYTKRAMAQAMVEAMEAIGFVHFRLAGHDRGGRVGYRLA